MKLTTIQVKNYKSFIDSGEVKLDQINVLVGRNNVGKSAFIHATHLLQVGAEYSIRDIRLGASQCEVVYGFTDISGALLSRAGAAEIGGIVTAAAQGNRGSAGIVFAMADSTSPPFINPLEPDNFVYTYLSKRKVTTFDQVVNQQKTYMVSNNLQNLVSKVDRLANPDYPKAQEYAELCKSVLGFRISTIASPGGHEAGIPVGSYGYIPIEAMGEGVSSLLGLITDLCVADGNLFLVEELENDIHPEGLKTILEVIVEKSANSQFIISTHSNIVTKYLGSAQHAKVFNVELEYQPGSIPTSTIHEIEPTAQARIEVLRQLGYELYDFDLWEGWLILEESSAEVIIRDYLIPWFAPRLSRVRTVSAGGTGKVGPTFEDFRRLFLFTHLEPQYKDRAWVVADGDDSGRQVVSQLREKYTSWSADHFRTWTQPDFELYYPANFAAQVQAALAKGGTAKRAAKENLLDDVKQWCDENRDEAKQRFEQSAAEVIGMIQKIEQSLLS